jgi:geranyl-CoA carboxylase beta subunit
MADDYLTKGGSFTQLGGVKRQRMLDIALNNKLPVIALAQSVTAQSKHRWMARLSKY